jgi:hypothetical protein
MGTESAHFSLSFIVPHAMRAFRRTLCADVSAAAARVSEAERAPPAGGLSGARAAAARRVPGVPLLRRRRPRERS